MRNYLYNILCKHNRQTVKVYLIRIINESTTTTHLDRSVLSFVTSQLFFHIILQLNEKKIVKTLKKQGPAGQRWVIGRIKQIKHFQHIKHFNQIQSWPAMGPWAMDP